MATNNIGVGNATIYVQPGLGASWKYEKGFAGTLAGPNFIAMGNQLAPDVLTRMSTAFRTTADTLAQRLLAAIVAGQKAGGQITGKQSAALIVKGSYNSWYDDVDLRVDDSKDPFCYLTRLLQYHYGRIRLNQAIYALRMGNRQRGITLLAEAQSMTKGWNGLQGKVALAWLLFSCPQCDHNPPIQATFSQPFST